MRKSVLLVTSAVVALAVAPGVWAQTNSDNGTQVAQANTGATSARSGIETIVVQARKRSEDIQDVPLSVTAFTGEDLQEQGVVGFEGLQRETPGLQAEVAAANPSAVIFTMRGQTMSDSILTIQPAVGVYVNGVYIPREAGLQQAFMDIDHVEVDEGPQGTLFGKNTTGGAIQLFTVQPGDRMEGFLDGEYASYNEAIAKGAITVPIVDGVLTTRFSGLIDSRGSIEHSASDNNPLGTLNTKGGRFTALYTPNNKLSVNFDLWGERDNNGGYRERLTNYTDSAPSDAEASIELNPASAAVIGACFAGSPTCNPAAFGADLAAGHNAIQSEVNSNRSWGTGSYSISATHGTALTVNYGVLPDVNFKSITAYEGQEDSIYNDIDGTSFLLNQTAGQEIDHFFSEEAEFSGTAFDDRLIWMGGLYYNFEKGWDQSESGAFEKLFGSVFSYIAHIDDNSFSVFTQETYKITDRLNLTGGIRWTTEENDMVSHNSTGTSCNFPPADQVIGYPNCTSAPFKQNDSGLSYVGSLDYHFTDDVMAYVKTASSFRGGGNQDRGSAVPGSFAPYAPERSTDYEIGLKGDFFDHRLRINGDLYKTDSKNIQESTIRTYCPGGFTGNPPTCTGTSSLYTVITNAAAATIYGDELTVTALPMDNWTIQATMAQVNAQYTSYPDGAGGSNAGQQWAVPHITYSFMSSYVVPTSFGSVTARADWSWRSKVDLYPSIPLSAQYLTQGSYGLLNLRLSANIDKYDTEIAVYAKNLTNKQYFSNFLGLDNNPIGTDVGYLGDPRIFGISLTKHFGG